MAKKSAGLLVYRLAEGESRIFLVHPGGPFWKNKDFGAWTIPKGEIEPGADALAEARREFREETGQDIDGEFIPLGECRQAGGKIVIAWAVEGTVDETAIASNLFEMEWPPRSGRRQSFPEIDRGAWFPLAQAREKINKGQIALLETLELIVVRKG
jgi:predicted NUDIX family NTP pyrophosphohydrolase